MSAIAKVSGEDPGVLSWVSEWWEPLSSRGILEVLAAVWFAGMSRLNFFSSSFFSSRDSSLDFL